MTLEKGHSTEHAIAQLEDQIYESFESNDNYTAGFFVDLSKKFDTVTHTVLLKKLEIYGITGGNLSWFGNYLANRKQYICIINGTKTNEQKETRGAAQGLILGPLLFLIYVNDLPIGKLSPNKLSLYVKKLNFQFSMKLVGEIIYHLCYQNLLLIIK